MQMQKSPFSLATDGSNDNGLLKMNPLTVRIFDINLGKVKTSLLDMCVSKGGTAEELLTTIDNCMSAFGIPWDNCVAVGVDNTSVNLEKITLSRQEFTKKTTLYTSMVVRVILCITQLPQLVHRSPLALVLM